MARRSGLALVALALLAAPVAAQNPVELGIDGGLEISASDPSGFIVRFPTGNFRAGFPAGERLSIEPKIAFLFGRSSGDSFHSINAELGVLFHLKGATTGSRAYLRPLAGITYAGGGGASASQFRAGAGIGVKLPMRATRMAWRLEAGIEHRLHNDDFDSFTGIFALFGISFFTR